MGFPIVAIHKPSQKIILISEVIDLNAKYDCICGNCCRPLVAVLNTFFKVKYFRHKGKPCDNYYPETELHLLAKQILLNNDSLLLPNEGVIHYTNPRAELKQNELIPDVTVDYNGSELFIEIVVTHPIDEIKRHKYQSTKAKVLVINLREELRNMPYDFLKPHVLTEESNREWLLYDAEIPPRNSEDDDSLWKGVLTIFGLIGVFLLGNYLFKKFNPKPSYYLNTNPYRNTQFPYRRRT